MKETTARIYRRHKSTCKYRGVEDAEKNSGGSWAHLDCNCPLYGDGYVDGKRVLRKSLDTRNQAKASKKLSELMATYQNDPQGVNAAPVKKGVKEAVDAFLDSHGLVTPEGEYRRIRVEFSTFRKYRNSVRQLQAFCTTRGIVAIADFGLEQFDAFVATRHTKRTTSGNEIQLLRKFSSFCLKRKWVTENVAKNFEMPRIGGENDIEPYTPLEESRILSACDTFGRSSYERLRARAMVGIHRYTALSISDVATFQRSRVLRDEEKACWRVFVRRTKTGEAVYLPIPDELKAMLDALPLPRKAPENCPYLFWNGVSKKRAAVGVAERTMKAVFDKSGVKNGGTHRFRHTLATRLAARGYTFERIADVLGNTPEIVRKHYAKWAKGRQDGIDEMMFDYAGPIEQREERKAVGTVWVQKEKGAVRN